MTAGTTAENSIKNSGRDTSARLARLGRRARQIAFFLATATLAGWCAVAFSVHQEGVPLYICWAVVAAATVSALVLKFRGSQLGWSALAIMGLTAAGWYGSIQPSDARDWAPEVAHGVTARVNGDEVLLDNVRNFDRAGPVMERWESHGYDLAALSTVELISADTDGPDIARHLVRFGFDDGRTVVFSVQVRREADETYTPIGALFRQFEVVLIAATDQDILRAWSSRLGDAMHSQTLTLSPAQRREVFMSYVDLAQELAERPAFYSSLTQTIATTLLDIARQTQPDMKVNWRVVLSGHLPDCLQAMGAMADAGRHAAHMASADEPARPLPATSGSDARIMRD